MPTRAWELMVGSILALSRLPELGKEWQRNMLTLSGLALILYSISFYTVDTPFPGVAALVPVFGSALIIYSGKREHSAQKVLTLRPLVFIGLISYSLYLWHWPLVAFTKYMLFRPFNGFDSTAIILASLILASFSWKFIEQPFRAKQMLLPEPKRLFVVAGVVMVVAVGIGRVIYLQNGMAWRHPVANQGMNQAFWEWDQKNTFGTLRQNPNDVNPGLCGDLRNIPRFVLWGDSHAMALVPGIDEMSRKYGICGAIATHSECPPILGLHRKDDAYDIASFNLNVIKYINGHPHIRVVVLAAAWPGYINGTVNFGQKNSVEKGLRNTVNILNKMNKIVVLVGDVPYLENYSSPRVFFLSKRFPEQYKLKDLLLGCAESDYNEFNANVYCLFKDLTEKAGVQVIRSDHLFFVDNKSIAEYNGIPLYRDANHLSTYGSHFVAPVFEPLFKEMARN